MSTIPSVNPMTELAKNLVQRFDANKDGSLTTDEFASFLTSLLGRMTVSAAAAASATPAAGAAKASATAAATTTTSTKGTSRPPTTRVRQGAMLGFDEGKLGNATHTSFKYQVGRILQYYPNTPEGLQQALAEIRQLVPGARIVGTHGDKIDFGDYEDSRSGRIGVVDVLVGAGDGGRGWAWQPVEDETASAPVTKKA
jgi:hypothetical protein